MRRTPRKLRAIDFNVAAGVPAVRQFFAGRARRARRERVLARPGGGGRPTAPVAMATYERERKRERELFIFVLVVVVVSFPSDVVGLMESERLVRFMRPRPANRTRYVRPAGAYSWRAAARDDGMFRRLGLGE